MRVTIKNCRIGILAILLNIASGASAQTVLSDTISKNTADLRRTTQTVVNFDANKLHTILVNCIAKGIFNVQFIFVTVRAQDTARYFSKHPNVMKEDRGSLIGKPTLLLKVPRRAFNLAMNEDPLKNKLIRQLIGAGFMLLDSPYGGGVGSQTLDALYFDLGTVCPPPSNCD